MNKDTTYIGVDLQLTRNLSFAVIDDHAEVIENGWISPDEAAARLADLADTHRARMIGIDAPRMPLPVPRQHYWNGNTASWRHKRPSDRGFGRHCEVVIAACALARPQWTPTADADIPTWMACGFALFESLDRAGVPTAEVFPSAAYRMLTDDTRARVSMPLSGFLPGPKDMLDAIVAAFSVREFVQGRGCAVGGGDGLGTIVLPRPVDHPNFTLVTRWPDEPS